jgi:hypothetical protein
MTYKLIPYSINGTLLNSAAYSSWFEREIDPFCLVTAEPVETVVEGTFPTSSGSQPQSLIMPLYVRIIPAPGVGVTQAQLDAFKILFDSDSGDVVFKAIDGSTTPITYEVTAKVIDHRAKKNIADTFVIRLYIAHPIFLNDTPVSHSQTATSSPKTWSETPVGSKRTWPNLTFQPTVAKSHAIDYLHRWQIIFCWQSEFAGVDSNGCGYPINLNPVGGTGFIDLSAEYSAARLLANGNDLRVLVDGEEVPREIDTTLAADYIWIWPIHKPMVAVTNAVAMASSSSPGVGEWIELSNILGTSGLPPSGIIVFGTECIRYDNKTLTAIRVQQRGACNTTAASHPITTVGLWKEHDIQIISDNASAGAPPDSTLTRPVINLATSTNLYHARPGPQITRATPLRVGQVIIDPREEGSGFSPMRVNDTGTVLKFIDSIPAAGQPKCNGVSLYCPCGIKAAAAALEQDVTVAENILARVYGSDLDGNESLLAEYNPVTDGVNKQITPTSVLQRIRYATMVRTLTAQEHTPGGTVVVGPVDYERAQSFTLDQECWVYGVSVELKKTAGADGNVVASLGEYSGTGDPDTVTWNWVYQAQLAAAADISASSFGIHTCFFPAPVRLSAGHYFITLKRTASAALIYWSQGYRTYAKGEAWTSGLMGGAGVWTQDAIYGNWFRILGDGSICQPEVPAASAAEAEFDNIEITFDNTTPRTPLIFISPQETIYMLRGAAKNDTSGQTLTFMGIPVPLNTIITVNTLAHTVIRNDTGESISGLITPTDIINWMWFIAAANSLRYTESGIGTVLIGISYQDAFA